MWQLQLSNLTPTEKNVAVEIIYNLDEDGRLPGEQALNEIAEKSGVAPESAEKILKKVQEFDPIGVASRSIQECLLIQAKHFDLGPVVEQIISEHLSNLDKKNYKAISRDLKISMDDVIEATKMIHELEPRPAQPFTENSTQYITPDIYVQKIGDDYVVLLNEDGLPKLKINTLYQKELLKKDHSATKDYIKEKLQSAAWLIRSIHQRQRTIYKVTKSIVKFQRDFFDRGVGYLKPLVLRDVAEDVSMHESTISRVTTNKYVHTPQGIFELKYFFNTGIKSDDGDSIASETIKNKISHLVKDEDAKKPLSDEKIVKILEKDNIKIARRTVTKYREIMGILPSNKRKQGF
jgi:RNA polymerase sigma-54 factor